MSRYAVRTKGIKNFPIRELLNIMQKPEVLSFPSGLPAIDLFPIERFEEACRKVLEQNSAQALQYGETEGYQPLREMVARHTARYGINAQTENVLITTGSQHESGDVIDRANKANIVINTIDARGLYVSSIYDVENTARPDPVR